MISDCAIQSVPLRVSQKKRMNSGRLCVSSDALNAFVLSGYRVTSVSRRKCPAAIEAHGGGKQNTPNDPTAMEDRRGSLGCSVFLEQMTPGQT